jgi:hypothetical protein
MALMAGLQIVNDPKLTSKPKASCNPPYTVDADGVRVLKRECC